MGLKSFQSSAPTFFGIKTRKVTFSLLTNLLCSWNSLKKLITSSFTKSQANYQNAIVKPLGPRTLSPLQPTNAPCTSSSMKGTSKASTSKFCNISHCSLDKGRRQSPRLDTKDLKAFTISSLIQFSFECQTPLILIRSYYFFSYERLSSCGKKTRIFVTLFQPHFPRFLSPSNLF